MEQFGKLMEIVFKLLYTEFTLFGYRFSFFSVMILSLVFGVVCVLINGVLGSD